MLKLIIPAKLNEQTICAAKWKGKDTKVSLGNGPVLIRMLGEVATAVNSGKKSGLQSRFFEQYSAISPYLKVYATPINALSCSSSLTMLLSVISSPKIS